MTALDVLEAVRDVIRTEVGRSVDVWPATDLVEDLGLDSLALLSITVELENRFRVCLEPEADRALTRVGDVVELIVRLVPPDRWRAGQCAREEASE